MRDVFFYEAFEEEADALKRRLPSDLDAGFTWKTIQEAADAAPPAPPAPLISIRTQSEIPPEWASALKGILSRSTGYDHVRAYVERCGGGVACGYLPLYCHRACAEQAMLLWTALLRKLPRQMRQFSKFQRDGITGRECEHKKLLIVGVGNIGRETARIGNGLGMDVRGVDIVERHGDIAYVSISDGVPWADIIVCAMNLTAENAGYFNRGLLRKAARGAVFVNVSRGELSPSADLLALVEEGRLGGVGLDVYNHESDLAGALRAGRNVDDGEVQAALGLAEHPNVILTPHNAFNTCEAVERKAAQSVQQVEQFLQRGEFLWPVP